MKAIRCPVCDMDSSTSNLQLDQVGVVYHFCSDQCKNNFLARPSLYTEKPLKMVIKRRCFTLDLTLDHVQEEHLKQAMQRVMGIDHLQVDSNTVFIEYNLLEVTAKQIETALAKAGMSLGIGWSIRLKRGWIHYIEENELDILAAGDAVCCNKAPIKGA